jgi:hypothetical protein
MKSFFLLLLLSYAFVTSFAQWTGTPHVYNTNTGNIAIGPGTAVTPLAKLHIFDGNGGDQLRFSRGAGAIRFVQGLGLDNLYLYNKDGSKMYMFWKENGNVGIGTETPSAKLHVHNDETLLQGLGSIQLLNRVSGRGNNYFMESQWLVRDDPSSIGWTTARMHNGISIDDSFLQPGTDTRTWWERDPYNNIQSWGQGNQTYMTINGGNVGIGTTDPQGYRLAVAGKVIAEEIVVKLRGNWPDYVFEENYNLLPLTEVENYINQNKHLPEVPAAKEMEKNGVNLGEMNMLLLKKVEELTLYVIELKKEMSEQSKNIQMLQAKNSPKRKIR